MEADRGFRFDGFNLFYYALAIVSFCYGYCFFSHVFSIIWHMYLLLLFSPFKFTLICITWVKGLSETTSLSLRGRGKVCVHSTFPKPHIWDFTGCRKCEDSVECIVYMLYIQLCHQDWDKYKENDIIYFISAKFRTLITLNYTLGYNWGHLIYTLLLLCSDSLKMLTNTYRVLQKYCSFGRSNLNVIIFLENPSNITWCNCDVFGWN